MERESSLQEHILKEENLSQIGRKKTKMARTTDTLVEGIIAVDDDISLTPFIDVANNLVTDVCTDSGYTDAKLILIETWLAAHFLQIRDQAVDTEKAGKVSQKFQYKVDLILNQTKYGQMAQLIDTAGNLAQLSKRMEQGESASVSIGWLGTDLDTEDDD